MSVFVNHIVSNKSLMWYTSKFDYKNNWIQTSYQSLCKSVWDKGKMFMVWAKRESFGLRTKWIYIKNIRMFKMTNIYFLLIKLIIEY